MGRSSLCLFSHVCVSMAAHANYEVLRQSVMMQFELKKRQSVLNVTGLFQGKTYPIQFDKLGIAYVDSLNIQK